MDALSDDFYKARERELEGRVKHKRFEHIKGVSTTAANLATHYGFDEETVKKARLAGLLHDWDKGYDNAGIRKRAEELGLESRLDPWIVENMPRILHGPTAATALAKEYPEIPDDVIDAIYKHTTASKDMSPLAKVVYIADAIEPTRNFDAIDMLRDGVDEVSLDELYYRVYKFWIMALVEHDHVLYPETIDIWNDLAVQVQAGRIKSDRSKQKISARREAD